MAARGKTPITLLTGFAGAGKTTLLLNLLPQLRANNPNYNLALIKNEIGDVAVDSALAAAAELTGSKELLGDCICCTNVGQIESALEELMGGQRRPDRVVIETSGSAEPLKLVLEVNRIARETGAYELDGVISVIDAENWGGYASTSFTAKLQAQQTDLIVINKWEGLGEREYDLFLDRLGDLDVQTPQVRSQKGVVGVDVMFGLDERMAGGRSWAVDDGHEHDGHHHHDGKEGGHRDEVECVSVTLTSPAGTDGTVDLSALEKLLKSAPKDEVFRIKAIMYADSIPANSDGTSATNGLTANGASDGKQRRRLILNWSFGRWTWTVVPTEEGQEGEAAVLKMSIFTAQYESNKWMKKIQSGEFVKLLGGDGEETGEGKLEVKRVQ